MSRFRSKCSFALASLLVTAGIASGCGSKVPVAPPVDGGAAASADGGPAGDGGSAGSADGGLAADGGGLPADAGVVETVYEMSLRGPMLAPGEEKTFCIVKRLDNAEIALVRQIATTLSNGSHHLVVYRYNTDMMVPPEQPEPFECSPFVEVARLKAVPIMISQSHREQLPLPDGVVYELEARQMVRIEAHYLNATTAPVMVDANVRFHTVPNTPTLQRADFLFFGTPDIDLPAGATRTVGPRFISTGIPENAKVFAMTTHTHQWGTQFKVEKATGRTGPGEYVYNYADWQWSEPPVKRFGDGGMTFQPGEGVRFSCDYNNRSSRRVQFGESAEKEMCFLWLYYYPSAGFRMCLDTDQGLQGPVGEICCPGHALCSLLANF